MKYTIRFDIIIFSHYVLYVVQYVRYTTVLNVLLFKKDIYLIRTLLECSSVQVLLFFSFKKFRKTITSVV